MSHDPLSNMTIAINNKERLFPKQELLGSSPQKRKGCAWRDGWRAALGGARGVWMGGTRLWRGPAVLECWHAALELGARTVWMGGTRLRSWGPAWELKEHLHGWGLGGLLCISLPFSWGLRELGAVEGGARSGSLDALCGF